LMINTGIEKPKTGRVTIEISCDYDML